jgi:hypothetical protein
MVKKLSFLGVLMFGLVGISYAQQYNQPITTEPTKKVEAAASSEEGVEPGQQAQTMEKPDVSASSEIKKMKQSKKANKFTRDTKEEAVAKEPAQPAAVDSSPCNKSLFTPSLDFQSRTIWATYLVLAKGRALPIQSYIVNQCVVIAVLPNGNARLFDYSEVDFNRTGQYITTEQEVRRLYGTSIITSSASGSGTVLGEGYYDLGRTSVPAPKAEAGTASTTAGGTTAAPAASGTSQGGTSPTSTR